MRNQQLNTAYKVMAMILIAAMLLSLVGTLFIQ